MVYIPTFKYERELLAQGYRSIVGVDEAGCGALAGPLVAAAAILPLNSRLGVLRDSKTLSQQQKDTLFEQINEKAEGLGVGIAEVHEIEQMGLRKANLLAMRRAIEEIAQADFALIDAWEIPGLGIPQRGIVRGDRDVKSIAAASVIAKVTRDRMMIELAKSYPRYRFEEHKGYATKMHRELIDRHGPCEIHRMTYKTFRPTPL